jgi:hypothetical protein
MDNFAEMGARIGVPVIARSPPWRITPAERIASLPFLWPLRE